jgi:hypothetical protein
MAQGISFQSTNSLVAKATPVEIGTAALQQLDAST